MRGWTVGMGRIKAERLIHQSWNGEGRSNGDLQKIKMQILIDRTTLCNALSPHANETRRQSGLRL